MIIYNKLVRDRIPEIIFKQKKKPFFRKIEDKKEIIRLLEEKLLEEFEEFKKEKNAEELADLLEVIFSIGKYLGFSQAHLLKVMREKGQKRGRFNDGLFLESVDEGSLPNG